MQFDLICGYHILTKNLNSGTDLICKPTEQTQMNRPQSLIIVTRRFLLPFFLFHILISLLNAQDSASIPVDLKVVKKTLENGLTYFIRENKKPENRASFRLVVNTGSMMETDEQRGLAHFIEHMAFNGTEHFKKQELVDYLESIGMRFGADLNAYTSFDETVYMLEIPMDDPEILAKGFQVLEDWAHLVSFNNEEIEKERGVVVEEWRLGRGAQGRIRDKQIPVLFHASRYADRLPIGKVDIIKSAPREQFLDYYKKWYRPNLMAIIAVGDFKTAEIEALIIKHFSHLKNPKEAPERILYPVPDHQETLFSIETDPEMPYAILQISYKHPVSTQTTLQDYRRSLIESIYTTLLNQRLSERVQQAEPPYLQAGTAKTQMVRSKDVVMQFAVLKEDQFAEGLKTLLIEAARAERDGFTQTELDRGKADMLRMFERAYQEREKTNHSAYVGEYTRHFLYGESIPGIEKELELLQDFLPGIALPEVNRIAADWVTEENRVILFAGPEKEGFHVPTQSEILAVVKEADSAVIEAYDDGVSDTPLLANIPHPGKIVDTSEIEELDLTIWTLSNGIRVLLKPTSFKNDQILVQAFSPGGHSLVEDELFVPASTADLVIGQSGLADFNLIQLRKMLAGKLVSVSASINEQSEGMRGSTSPSDLEYFFQLVHLTFTQPRADSEIFQSLKTRLREIVKNRLSDPKSVFDDAVEEALYG
ncbi:MAG TPA: insulinase family protein, partial [Verrucomicrobia bacterium]|nr:insulinase family protein [Verrucomicrobiota bacterium]